MTTETLPALVASLLVELSRECQAKAAAPARTPEGRELGRAYSIVAEMLMNLQTPEVTNHGGES